MGNCHINGLKGQQVNNPGQRPGYHGTIMKNAPQGQKQFRPNILLPFQGEKYNSLSNPQGNALGK